MCDQCLNMNPATDTYYVCGHCRLILSDWGCLVDFFAFQGQ